MSLYGGIKFSIPTSAELTKEAPKKPASSTAPIPKSTSESRPFIWLSPLMADGDAAQLVQPPIASSPVAAPIPAPAPAASASTSASSSSTAAKAAPSGAGGSSGEWSAALKFAPRPKKVVASSSSTSRLPAWTTISAPSTSNVKNSTYTAASVIVKPAELAPSPAASATDTIDEVMLGTDGRPLAKAPSMTLHTSKGYRKGGKGRYAPSRTAAPRPEGDGEGKKRKKKKKKQQQPLTPLFDPEEQYDPTRPNDLGEYQAYRKRLRAERRAAIMEEKRRKDAGESSGSSEYTDSEDDAPVRRDAPKLFAPPRMYSPPSSTRSLPSAPPAPQSYQPPPPPAPVLSAAATGDDAYARRLAMSQAATGDDAYARRAAMAAKPAPTLAATSEDYARRAALVAPPPSAPTPIFVPPPPSAIASAPPPIVVSPTASAPAPTSTASGRARMGAADFFAAPPPPPNDAPLPPTQPPPPPPTYGLPGFGNYAPPPPPPPSASAPPPPPPPTDDYQKALEDRRKAAAAIAARFNASAPPPPPAFAPAPPPPSFAPPPPASSAAPPPPPTAPIASGEKSLEERKAAAQAIAARLQAIGALGGAAGPTTMPPPKYALPKEPSPPPLPGLDEVEGNTWAEKMMKRWGHKDGEGLGRDGGGITSALSLEHIDKPIKAVNPNQPLSKRQIAKQKAAAANAKNRKWVQHGHNKGKIIDSTAEDRAAMEKARVGEASRVVCLRGVVESVDDVDEDLADEIGEECAKYGIVERVVLHVVEPPPPDPADGVRVFVVFSGMAGAWRSTRELDGRFFAGQKLRATYYDEAQFDAGERDNEIS